MAVTMIWELYVCCEGKRGNTYRGDLAIANLGVKGSGKVGELGLGHGEVVRHGCAA